MAVRRAGSTYARSPTIEAARPDRGPSGSALAVVLDLPRRHAQPPHLRFVGQPALDADPERLARRVHSPSLTALTSIPSALSPSRWAWWSDSWKAARGGLDRLRAVGHELERHVHAVSRHELPSGDVVSRSCDGEGSLHRGSVNLTRQRHFGHEVGGSTPCTGQIARTERAPPSTARSTGASCAQLVPSAASAAAHDPSPRPERRGSRQSSQERPAGQPGRYRTSSCRYARSPQVRRESGARCRKVGRAPERVSDLLTGLNPRTPSTVGGV